MRSLPEHDRSTQNLRHLRPIKLFGLLCTAAGLAILIWLASVMYGRTEIDEALLVALGIPLLLLIAWSGVTLAVRGFAWILPRR